MSSWGSYEERIVKMKTKRFSFFQKNFRLFSVELSTKNLKKVRKRLEKEKKLLLSIKNYFGLDDNFPNFSYGGINQAFKV